MKKYQKNNNLNNNPNNKTTNIFGNKSADAPVANSANTLGGSSTDVVENLSPSSPSPEVLDLINDLKRTRADFENFRKQSELQKANEKSATRLATIYKILPLLDDFDRAISAYQELGPLQKSLEKTLKELQLVKINSDINTDFNPDLHDAISVEDGDGEKEVIAETLRPGYYYDGTVLRPAMVKVKRI